MAVNKLETALKVRDALTVLAEASRYLRVDVIVRCQCKCSCHSGSCQGRIDPDTLDCAYGCRSTEVSSDGRHILAANCDLDGPTVLAPSETRAAHL